jgi:hypothetical protein
MAICPTLGPRANPRDQDTLRQEQADERPVTSCEDGFRLEFGVSKDGLEAEVQNVCGLFWVLLKKISNLLI